MVDRCQSEAFFQFNCASQELVPGALLSPVFDRTKEQVLGDKLDYATKLVFVPAASREKDEPLDLHISHCGY